MQSGIIHQKLLLVHGFHHPAQIIEYVGPDHSIVVDGEKDGETHYWVVIPHVIKNEYLPGDPDDPLGAEIAHFDSREEALGYINKWRYSYLEGAPLDDE